MSPSSPQDSPALDGTDLLTFAVLLRRMNGEFNRVAHEFAGAHGLHPTDIHALSVILDADVTEGRPMTPGRLRERLNLTSGAVTACIDRLERAGHITRVRDAEDRRVVHLRYEAAARDLARRYFEPLARSTEAALARFDEEQLGTIAAFLEAVNEELSARR
ncbi:MarR family winged helix-turn-helix transcriptional regulator [Allostreptomyces psammosilenae]|uniref:DNA-binding MarR family transcriptional regulator n=1 Tax=Allostreptomyces psammosilenae TaxID=1892865 RepID=A0A853A2K7_9ACTN|nr:MarR family transcriptional regulator [Allostreptomyces psammosilenae]NYI04688.1 DNA-binding MarR family transcriptional regulator [Allostreptomyces psammosilenae]